jgi:CHAT domain-containing protein
MRARVGRSPASGHRMAADESVGRSEAVPQLMLALINTGNANEAHPSYWAPFVVVGEGG